MVRGLYTACTGMVNQMNRMDVITNNLANSDTTAYKKEGATSQSFDAMYAVKLNDETVQFMPQLIGQFNLGAKIGETYTDYSDGSVRATGNDLDVALSGKGFFAISYADKNGNESIRYTRDGNFAIDANGILKTKDGDILNSEGEAVAIPQGTKDVLFTEEGEIFADGEYVGSLNIVDFEDYDYLKKFGENMYIAIDGAQETEPNCIVTQGYLEMSNVNVVSEMVDMIATARDYESNQKVIQAIDETLEKAVGIGKA